MSALSGRLVLLAIPLLVSGCLDTPGFSSGPSEASEAAAWLAEAWGDAREVTLVEEAFTVSKAPMRAGGVFSPGERLVLPGTERVEVVLSWPSSPAGPETLQLLFDSGATAGRPEAREARNGEPVVIDGAGATDAPYQAHSHWWFGAFPTDDTPALPETAVQMRVTAYRAETLPDLAPNTRGPGMLLDGAQTTNRGLGPVCPMCEGTGFSAAPGAIVAETTRVVRATISNEGETDAPGIVAWTPSFGQIDMENVGDGVWEVAPPLGSADSPFQTKSLWWFFLVRPVPVQSGTTTLTVETLS